MCHHHKIDGSHMQGARLRAVWNHTSILVPWQHILSMLILQLNGVLYIVNVFQKTSKILLKVTRIILWHRNVYCETEWIYIHGKMKGSVSFELAVKLKIRWGFLLCRLESVNLTYTELPVITPHTCARGKAISSVHLSVCQHKNCQIWRYRYQSDWQVWSETVKNCLLSASECLTRATSTTNCVFSSATPIDPTY